MKMNMKMFKQLNNPVEILEVEGKVVEVHYMNDTNYLAQYAGQGRFFAWSSDGNIYKLLVERGYYEELGELFLPEVSALQIKLHKDHSKVMKRVYFSFPFPVILIIIGLIIATYFVEYLQGFRLQIILGSFVALIVVLFLHSKILNKRIEKLSNKYFDDIEAFFGEEKHRELVIKEREYYASYFDFDEEVEEAPIEDAEPELIDVEEGEVLEEPKVVPAWVSGDAQDEVVEEELVEDEVVEEELVEEEVAEEEVVEDETIEELEAEIEDLDQELEELDEVIEELDEAILEVEDKEVDLSILSIDSLKDFARDRKIVGFSTMRKGELVEALPGEYDMLRVVELQELARAEKIPNFSTMRKQELIEALKVGYVVEEEEEVVEEVEKDVTVMQVVDKDGNVDLDVLTVAELKEFAKDRKVSGFSTMRKGELVDSLPTDIHDLRLVELKAVARAHSLPNHSTMRKDELVEGLLLGVPIVEEVEEAVEEKIVLINVLNEDGTADLNHLTLNELKEFAKDRKITGFSTMRKVELVDALPSAIDELRTVELKALARAKKVPNFSTMRKAELIEAIK